jgi:hypothetical protein
LRRREGIFEPGGALALAPGAKAYCRYYGIQDDVSFMPEDRGSSKTLAEKGNISLSVYVCVCVCVSLSLSLSLPFYHCA